MPTDKRAAALAWAARGFRVFPLSPWSKFPIKEGWTQTADNDPAYVWNTWTGPNGEALNYNIGVLTTDLCVADIDMKNGRNGWGSFTSHGGSVDTLMVRTPTGGYHAYYCGALVANGVDRQDGIDIRGHNGYVIAPGSELPEGLYELVSDQPISLAPDWLVDIAKPIRHRHEKADIPLIDLDQPAAIALAAVTMRDAPSAIIGERDQRAYEWACQMRDLGVSEAVALSVMVEWAARSLIPLTDLQEKVQNAYLYAQNQAGSKSPLLHFAGVDFESLRLPDAAPATPQVPAINPFSKWGNALAAADLKPRKWVFRNLAERGEIAMATAPGGAGKSLLQLHAAVDLACGTDLFGFKNACGGPKKSIVYNAEDSLQEMSKRLHAICTQRGVDVEQVKQYISLVSGKDLDGYRLSLMDANMTVNIVDTGLLDQAASDPECVAIFVDPISKLHKANENDNGQMNAFMEVLEKIAQRCDVAIICAQHTPKAGAVSHAGNADAGRGASSVRDSARTMLTLMPPTDEDCNRFGIKEADRKMFVRLDVAKENRSVSSAESIWLHKEGIQLFCGDTIGTFSLYNMKDSALRESLNLVRTVKLEMEADGKSSKPLTVVVKSLANHPMFRAVGERALRSRVEAAIGSHIDLPEGGRVRITQEGSTYLVVLE